MWMKMIEFSQYSILSQLLYCLQNSSFYFVNKLKSLTYVVNSPTFQLFCMDAMPKMAYTILDVPFVLIFDTYPHSGHWRKLYWTVSMRHPAILVIHLLIQINMHIFVNKKENDYFFSLYTTHINRWMEVFFNGAKQSKVITWVMNSKI